VGRIGQPAVREGIRHQKVAEFVMNSGNGGWQEWQEQQANCGDSQKDAKNCQRFVVGETGEDFFDATENYIGSFWGEEGESAESETG
jgi:hypothetical protein